MGFLIQKITFKREIIKGAYFEEHIQIVETPVQVFYQRIGRTSGNIITDI